MSRPPSRAASLFSSRPSTPAPSTVSRDPDSLDVWILGSGIASLTAAVHLIREAKVPPSRIHILEALSEPGAGSVGKGDAESGYHFRAECMPQFCGSRMEELLALVPSERPEKSVWDDIRQYFEEHVSKQASRTRFLARRKNGLERIGRRRLHLGVKDRMDLFRLSSKAEDALGRSRIQDHFSEGFFRTEYWLVLSTLAAEFRRFIQHFPHDIQTHHPRPLDHFRFNLHDSVVAPVARFLQAQGVDFRFNTITTDIIVEPAQDPTRVTTLRTVYKSEREVTIDLGPHDIIIVSLGSVLSGASCGSNTEPPSLEMMEIEKDLDDNWLLWLELATKHPKFGNAYNFCTRLRESRVAYFTVTVKNPAVFEKMLGITGDDPATGSLVTLRDSSWLLTLNLPRQPLFPDQPDGVRVFWGYALDPENEGDFVKKQMLSCSGEEILTEVLRQLDLPVDEILPQTITVPCVMPRLTSVLLPRSNGDRPRVVPPGMTNMALIGQFVDIPEEMVTMDYMVRGAQMAVHQLMGLEREMKKSKKGSTVSLLGFPKD
ncbi:oleate hydratase [Aspergillus fischeri NRRL 181]|uniref:67 kDa myosin-cross-reactive antigen family protein n=1 Tax=Neosartorya fischeri (strain ATCC 1020 / DSM 3700 / CBS 544.65 / FGSC A1164 / JCM 1740 / NRRL 181 / WB 181) TaxID=331117 RepID=A1DEJ0_NEOFI|nr:67 kDa myosin-cross-reactive antigen family protein [Aspergillus fischeri NRRL 181]EAW17797.1 67 kDa myosin-cross-reactive antigen family protein [Aspergillus fischeri NRRL 181]